MPAPAKRVTLEEAARRVIAAVSNPYGNAARMFLLKADTDLRQALEGLAQALDECTVIEVYTPTPEAAGVPPEVDVCAECGNAVSVRGAMFGHCECGSALTC